MVTLSKPMLLSLAAVVGVASFFAIRMSHTREQVVPDFRSLGYITLIAPPIAAAEGEINTRKIRATVYLAGDMVRPDALRLVTTMKPDGGPWESTDRTALLEGQRAGTPAVAEFTVVKSIRQIRTCLTLKSAGNETYRVSQLFKIETLNPSSYDHAILVTPVEEPEVSVERGAACTFDAGIG